MSDTVILAILAAVVGSIGGMTSAIIYCYKKIEVLQKAETECRTQVAVLNVEINYLKSGLSQLQTVSLRAAPPCFITATIPEGSITEVSEEVLSMLGWRPGELIGKNIDIVIPEEFRQRHHDGVVRAVQVQAIRPGTIAVAAYAMHKLGSKLPVIVTLTEMSKDPWKVTAQINYRAGG